MNNRDHTAPTWGTRALTLRYCGHTSAHTVLTEAHTSTYTALMLAYARLHSAQRCIERSHNSQRDTQALAQNSDGLKSAFFDLKFRRAGRTSAHIVLTEAYEPPHSAHGALRGAYERLRSARNWAYERSHRVIRGVTQRSQGHTSASSWALDQRSLRALAHRALNSAHMSIRTLGQRPQRHVIAPSALTRHMSAQAALTGAYER